MSRDKGGRDALMNAAIDRQPAIAEQLLAKGADPNSADNAGWSALHFAAQNNDETMVRILLRYGAAISARNDNGNTPLWIAAFAFRGGPECLTVLLALGADPDLANNHGISPRILAETIANYDTAKFFD